jgi:hypothetical protein
MERKARKMEFITPSNVVVAAKFMLGLDSTFVDKAYWPELEKTVLCLKACLDDFLGDEHTPMKGVSHIVRAERALITLLASVRSFFPALTEEARLALQGFLLSTPSDKPPFAIAMRGKPIRKNNVARSNREIERDL